VRENLLRPSAFRRDRVRVFLLAIVTFAVVGFTNVAYACPACVGQQKTLSPTLKLVGLFILFPYLVVTLVLRSIRKAVRDVDPADRG
jgi:hypothetical protein